MNLVHAPNCARVSGRAFAERIRAIMPLVQRRRELKEKVGVKFIGKKYRGVRRTRGQIYLSEDQSTFIRNIDRELSDQLELLQCDRLLPVVKYVLKILGDMGSDDYKFTARTYYPNIEQLLSDRWLRSEDLLRLLANGLKRRIAHPFARKILLTDVRVIDRITEKMARMKDLLRNRLDNTDDMDSPLTEEDQRKIREIAEKIEDECWLFFRSLKLFEATKILLTALKEHDEFVRDKEAFKEKYGEMHISTGTYK